MGKFGIGARVRDLDDHDGTIVEKAKGERLVKLDGSDEYRWLSKSDLRVVPTLRLVEGSYYTSRHGKTFGPLIPSADVERNNEWPWTVAGGDSIDETWTDTGHVYAGHVVDDNDLVAEVVLPAEPAKPQFGVGQRVVMVRERDGGFAPTVVAKIIGDDGQDYLPLKIEFEGEVNFGPDWYVDPADIAPFTLEAGKFYRTRDGRKVGPMVPGHYAAEWPLTVEHYFDTGFFGKAWRLDGTFDPEVNKPHSADIVAEWVEPVASVTDTIVVEDATDPVKPWTIADAKPGDVVRCDRWDGHFYTTSNTYTVDSEGRIPSDFTGTPYRVTMGEWSLVMATNDTPVWNPAVGDKIKWLGKVDASMLTVGSVYEIKRLNDGWVGITDDNQTRGDHSWDVGDLVDKFERVVEPQPTFKVGDRVGDFSYEGEATIHVVDGDKFRVHWDGEDTPGDSWWTLGQWLYHSPAELLTVGSEVILTSPATIRMVHGDRASLLMPSGGAFTLPIASLRLAA